MSRLIPISLFAILGFIGPVSAVPAHASEAPTISQFLKIRTPGIPRLLPDGSLIQRDWPDGVWQLYRVTPTGFTPNWYAVRRS